MANVANINVTISATDATGPGVNSAASNLGRLGSSFGSIGTIASGVFGGILGAATFRTITSGLGSVINSAFALQNRMETSKLVSKSMIETIASSKPIGEDAFGGLSQAAQQFERTMREVREREADGLADYADKIDDLKGKILEAEQEIASAKTKRIAEEKRQLEDLARTHEEKIMDLNQRLEDENFDFNERLYDMANQRNDRIESEEERKAKAVGKIDQDIADLQEDLALAATALTAATIQAKIDLLEQEKAETISLYDEEITEINQRADHEVAIATQKHEKKIQALQTELTRENEEYDRRKKRLEQDAAEDIARSEETGKKKIANLNKQLQQEEEMHLRFLRDIQEAYEDANEKMTAGGGGGPGGKRTLDFGFDFGDSFRKMHPEEITKFLDDVQKKYIEIGIATPFNIGDIQQFGQSVIQFTGGSADNMQKLVTMAEVLATKNPFQGMQGATLSLVELLGSGNITSLTRRFDLPKDAFAGLDSAKNETELITMLEQRMASLGLTSGIIEAKTQTLGGAWGNLVETFNYLSATVIKPIWQPLTDGLVELNKWLIVNDDQIGVWAATLGGIISSVFTPFGQGIIALAVTLKKFWEENGAQILQFFNDVGTSISTIVTPALQFLDQVWQLVQRSLEETIIPSMGRIFATLARFWQEIAPEVKKTLDFLKKWWTENSETILAIVKFVWAGIEFAIRFAIDAIKALLKIALAVIRGDWEAAWGAIRAFFVDTFNNIKDLAVNIWGAIGAAVRSGINSLIDQINNFIRKANDATRGKKIGPISMELNIPEIPRLAAGGIVTSPTLAMIGEAGPEAIVPLSQGQASGRISDRPIIIQVTGNHILNDEDAKDLAHVIGNAFVTELKLQGKYL